LYNELYEAWRRELENIELELLPSDFYPKIANYLRRLKEEGRMLDRRTVKARLLKNEMRNVKHMVRQLIQVRYGKLVDKIAKDEKISSSLLTIEEKKIYGSIPLLAETHQNFAKSILRGYTPEVPVEQKHHRAVVRFLKNVPAIIGADMKTYGPFKVEDVASLPVENSKILVRQRLADRVEI